MEPTRRNDEIEVLRAVGVLLVIFEHINALLYWRTSNFENFINPYGGVDLFFCISGFVITPLSAMKLPRRRDWGGAAFGTQFLRSGRVDFSASRRWRG